MIRIAYWGLVALDVMGLLFFYVLGLAAAGSSRTSPLLVTLYLLVLPAIPLLVSIVIYSRATSPAWRTLAFAVAAAPLVITASMHLYTRAQFAANSNAAGELTFYRAGPMRELIEAIRRNDAATVSTLVAKVDVNREGMDDMTPLIAALRQLRTTPDQQEVLELLLKAGADPNKGTKYETPLQMAVQVGRTAGSFPVQRLLDAGADPNQRNSFGTPIYFSASGRGASVDVLTLMLDHGADLSATDAEGATALLHAATTPNWHAVLLLLERGADWRQGRSSTGASFEEIVDRYAREKQDGQLPEWKAADYAGFDAVVAFLRPQR